MKYECKIYTSESFEARQKFINEQLKEKTGYRYTFERLELELYLNRLIRRVAKNEPLEEWEQEIPELVKRPTFEVRIFEKKEAGYQSQPRILWNDEILKIDEIDEIFSFIRK